MRRSIRTRLGPVSRLQHKVKRHLYLPARVARRIADGLGGAGGSDRDADWFLAGALAWRQLVDKTPPGVVVARARTEEAFVTAGQFLLTICLEGFDLLVVRSPEVLVLEAPLMQSVMRDPFGEASRA